MRLLKLTVLLLFLGGAYLDLYAQGTPIVLAQKSTFTARDSIKKEIQIILNNTEWEYSYYYKPKKGAGINSKNAKLAAKVTIENDSLIFDFEKLGIKSISLFQRYSFDGWRFIYSDLVFGNEVPLSIVITHPYANGNSNLAMNQAKQESTSLDKLLYEYKNVDLIVAQKNANAKEWEEFERIAKEYRESSDKPTLSEEQRKYIVMANAANKEMNYGMALGLYSKVVELNPTSFPAAYYNMALISAQIKNYSLAILNMKKYLLLVPEAEDARKAQDMIYEWEYKMKQ